MREERSKPDKAADDTRLAELVRQGLLTPATNKTSGPPPRLPVASFETIMRELDEDREDRF